MNTTKELYSQGKERSGKKGAIFSGKGCALSPTTLDFHHAVQFGTGIR